MKAKTVLFLLLVVFIIGCNGASEEMVDEQMDDSDQMADEQPAEVMDDTGAKGTPVESRQVQNQEDIGLDRDLAVDTSAELEKLSGFGCSYDEESGLRMLSLTLTNTNEEKAYMISDSGVKSGFNTYFTVRGIVVKNPGCGVEELAPGESITCNSIGPDSVSYTNQVGPNRVTVETPNDDGSKSTEAIIIECQG